MNEFVELSKRAKDIAKAKGFHEHADDFGQEAYLTLSSGRKAQINDLLIDFIRDTFGDTRYPNSMKNRLEYHTELPTSETIDISPEYRLVWDSIVNILEPKDRVLIVLKYYWGLEQKEIGYALGISEGRVSQRLKEILKDLRKKT